MIPWIYADLDTIIDSYSEAEEGERWEKAFAQIALNGIVAIWQS